MELSEFSKCIYLCKPQVKIKSFSITSKVLSCPSSIPKTTVLISYHHTVILLVVKLIWMESCSWILLWLARSTREPFNSNRMLVLYCLIISILFPRLNWVVGELNAAAPAARFTLFTFKKKKKVFLLSLDDPGFFPISFS